MIQQLTDGFINHFMSVYDSFMFSSTRWHNLHPVQDELSPSAMGFVQKLQEIFHTIKSSITPLLHNTIFEQVSLSIDNILLTQVCHMLLYCMSLCICFKDNTFQSFQ